jgi:hypothetical protein
MTLRIITWLTVLGCSLLAGSVWAYDCSGLPEWKRQHYYLEGAQVQYQGTAYENTAESSKRDFPDRSANWLELGACGSSGGGDDGGGGGDSGGDPVTPEPLSIFGAWHCGDDYCTWSTVRGMAEFDEQNNWLIDGGNGLPSVNLVVLSFVHPLQLLNGTEPTHDGPDVVGCQPCGMPVGMNQAVVDYFKNEGIRVMLSIGGITYVDPWNQALAEDAWQLGLNAAAVAAELGVGIEIDYEENRNPNLDGLQAFIDAYRSVHPYDPAGTDHAARLTIDLAAGDRWLIALTERATAQWLRTDDPVLDYANAMVDPPIPPLAPAKLTGSLWLTGRRPEPECVDFENSLQHPSALGDFVQTITPNGAGTSHGMLGFMFWAAECQGTRAACTTPEENNTCEGGLGAAAEHYNGGAESFLFPMGALRQQ